MYLCIYPSKIYTENSGRQDSPTSLNLQRVSFFFLRCQWGFIGSSSVKVLLAPNAFGALGSCLPVLLSGSAWQKLEQGVGGGWAELDWGSIHIGPGLLGTENKNRGWGYGVGPPVPSGERSPTQGIWQEQRPSEPHFLTGWGPLNSKIGRQGGEETRG